MSNPLDYTIGWICAIKPEYVAAQVFLDEEHPAPSSLSFADENTYTLGRMGDHNVVITVLPPGRVGSVNAAHVAVSLRRSFPNLQVTLMVGTAGGAPSDKHDIRLGDVVVSSPGQGHTGVFYYDFGKAIQNEDFLNTASLSRPPEVLQQATIQLQTRYETHGHQLQQSISEILDKYPKLRKGGYERPKSSTDRLYLSDVIHPPHHSEDDCAMSCGNNLAKMVERGMREGKDCDPSIYCGLIASGNTFISDAGIRDELIARNDVLCFDMETCGLMNALPCMAIRGISNYADTHVNKVWQGYAAMAAVAYAKDLLTCVPRYQVDTSKTMGGTEIPISFASCSIPMKIKASLPEKLSSIRNAGFDGIELSMPDIISYGELLNGSSPKEDDYDTLADVAKQIRSLTDELGLKIMMLQPFANFEGWKKGTHDKKRQQAFDKAKGWIKVMEAAGITLLQVGSSDSEDISSSFEDLASDLAELADLLAEKNFSIAYENWCWATHAPTWKTVWQIVQKANRPNIGLCLDTFQTAGYEWGDPTANDGLTTASSSEERQKRWEASLQELTEIVPADKIYLLQISDAYKMDPPIEDVKDEEGSRPRARWSHDYRPLPCDGGYLPVQDMMAAVLKTGFRSWLSVEVFDGLEGENTDINEYTQAAVESVKKLIDFSA
ncbi:xylose isomerase-like protein [Fusarium venenatum]|uniref:xylose isomerase-like protein n=1 Tax=Fusarium venenatum TaxID=56646 RepID=UPI001E0D5D08|nr:xylose isomerase-like protein [Fusarium venenatum]